MDSLSLILSPNDSLLLNQTITEIETRLQRQNIKLTMMSKVPLQNIMQGTLTGRFINQKFNSYWATPIRLVTKNKELWLELTLDQDLTNELLDIFENPTLVFSEAIAILSKEPNEPQSSEDILNLSIENFNFKERHETLTLLCSKEGKIRIEGKINFSMIVNTSSNPSNVQSFQASRRTFEVPPPSLTSQSNSPTPINRQAFTIPPPILPSTSTPFFVRQISTNMTRPSTRSPFSPLGARSKSQTKHISYVQRRINKKTGYHTYEDLESGSEIDFGMFNPSEKQRTYKKKSDSESIGIYEKLRNTIKRANTKEKQDEGLKLLDKIMSKMELGMTGADVHKLFIDEQIRGENSSGSDLEANVSNLMTSSKNGENTLVEFEPAKENSSEQDQSSEDLAPPELAKTLGNPFLPSPEKEKETNETSQIMTRSKCQKQTENPCV